MDKVFLRNDIKRRMRRLGLEQESAKYIAAAVIRCIDLEIDPLDIVLARDIYPILEKNYGKTPHAIETIIRRDIIKAWGKVDWHTWRDELDYDSRPTIKKLITILLEKIKNQR